MTVGLMLRTSINTETDAPTKLGSEPSVLEKHRLILDAQTKETVHGLEQRHLRRTSIAHDLEQADPLRQIHTNISHILKLEQSSVALVLKDPPKPNIPVDITLSIPSELSTLGAKAYSDQIVPDAVRKLEQSLSRGELPWVRSIKATGIYINIELTPEFFGACLKQAITAGKNFGLSSKLEEKRTVVDFSSPNLAKALHVGHIRSTVIGNALCSLLEHSGAMVMPTNHYNDWGGFGHLLEGWDRWQESLDPAKSKSDKLAEIYYIRRRAEKVASIESPSEQLEHFEKFKGTLIPYFPAAQSGLTEFLAEYQQFEKASADRFKKLETGAQLESELWLDLSTAALRALDGFYQSFDISIPIALGEGFYAQSGLEIVDQLEAEGRLSYLTAVDGSESPQDPDSQSVGFQSPDGATRLVFRRGDGSSVYSTRDIAALKYRSETLKANEVLYVVGQEQKDYLTALFQASKDLGVVPQGDNLQHLYFGYYTDENGQKLASRNGAADVISLLKAVNQHFYDTTKARHSGDGTWTEHEFSDVAHSLAIASIIIADLSKDRLMPVKLDRDVERASRQFEESGGAYYLYTLCRAKSLCRKAEAIKPEIPATSLSESSLSTLALDPMEKSLLKIIQHFPLVVEEAAASHNPTRLVNYIKTLVLKFNSFYNGHRAIEEGEVNNQRYLLSRAVAQTLENALNLCGIDCPERV